MAIHELDNFLLVGGTALSLYYGHRLSIDLDLFSSVAFKNEDIIGVLERNFKGFAYRSANNPIGVFGFIDEIKVDFVKQHHHPLIGASTLHDGIRMVSLADIVAMKINAVMKRGAKKDFYDIAELLQHYSVSDFINFYNKKYPTQQLLISVPHAIIYFEDADESEDPVSLKGQSWGNVKKYIQQKVSEYLR